MHYGAHAAELRRAGSHANIVNPGPNYRVKALLRRDRSATDLALSGCSGRRCLEQHCNVVKLAANLLGPVGLALARAEEQLPGPHGMPGGARFELKWDGFLH